MNWYTVIARAPQNQWCELLVQAPNHLIARQRVEEEYEFRREFTLSVEDAPKAGTILQIGGNVTAVRRK